MSCTNCRRSDTTSLCKICQVGLFCSNCLGCTNRFCVNAIKFSTPSTFLSPPKTQNFSDVMSIEDPPSQGFQFTALDPLPSPQQQNQGFQFVDPVLQNQQVIESPTFQFGPQIVDTPPMFVFGEGGRKDPYPPLERRKLYQTFFGMTEDPPPPKTKRKRPRVPSINKKKAPRLGITQSVSSTSTYAPNPLEISVASWNINHFEKEAQKKDVIRFLFEKHDWLDVLVLQEVNQGGRPKLESLMEGWDGIGCEFGPVMQGLSSSEYGPDSAKKPTTGSITIGGEQFDCRTYSQVKSFELKDSMGEWVWMRPNQPEYYPILFRTSRIESVKKWATYDGTEKLREEPLFWAKEVHSRTIDTRVASKRLIELLDEKKVPKSYREIIDPERELEVEFGRRSSSKKDDTRTWRFTVGDDVYQATLDGEGNITLFGKAPVIKPRCRPVIVYELTLKGRDEKVLLGVVHTTPAGSKMNRAGEMVQVKKLFEKMSDAPEYWIAAGDYYLDPESPIEGKRGNLAPRDRLFQSFLDQCGLQIVVSLSATNQSTLGNYKKDSLKDQVELKFIDPLTKEEKTKRVLNKRADFLVCNETFQFTFGGVFSPASGLLVVDPQHNALNWWAAISDHAPVGGILSNSIETRCRKYFQHNLLHEKALDNSRLEAMLKQIQELHASAVSELCHCQRLLIERIGNTRFAYADVSTAMEDIGEALDKEKENAKQHKLKGPTFELKPPNLLDTFRFSILKLQKALALVIDNLLCDGTIQQFNPTRTVFDHELFLDETKGFNQEILIEWMRFWSTMPSDYLLEIRDEELMITVSLTLEILRALRQLSIDIGEADLVPEAETYDTTGSLIFEK